MIIVDDLAVGYAEKAIVKNISFQLESGRIMVLLGANGSGKSTLLKTVAGILEPISGTININGKNISHYSSRNLAKEIAYLSQINSRTSLTVRQLVLHGRYPYLSFPRRYRQADIERAEMAIRTIELENVLDTPIDCLPGGTLQKAYIAMALAQETKIILLDEPTTFLDIRSQFQLISLIKELSGNGKTVIMILHDIPMVMQYADYIAVLHGGKILSVGKPDDILASGCLTCAFGINVQKIEDNCRNIYYCEMHTPAKK